MKKITQKQFKDLKDIKEAADILRKEYQHDSDELMRQAEKILGLGTDKVSDDYVWDWLINDFGNLDRLMTRFDVTVTETKRKKNG